MQSYTHSGACQVLTARILLSWFPNVARQPILEPVFVVTDPFFNIFRCGSVAMKMSDPLPPAEPMCECRGLSYRGLIPPIGGIDLSPLPAFFLLSFLSNATEALGAEPIKRQEKGQPKQQPRGFLRLPKLPQLALPSIARLRRQ
jgi:YggT family protein